MSGIIRSIEDAIIARLKLANTVQNFGTIIKTVDRYSGEFADENLDRLAEMAPFALVSHTKSLALVKTSQGVNWSGFFTVVCGSATKRTQTLTARIGGPSALELGSRQMAELTRDLLTGQSLGLPIKNLMPESIDEVYSGTPGGTSGQHWLSVTGIQLSCEYFTDRSRAADGGDVAAIVELHADWLLDGTAQSTTLPLDPPGDMESIVTLGGS
jgi:phage gp37-like protein